MRAFLTTLLQCSLSMTLVTLAYAAVLPLLSKRYAAKWRYLIWLVIAVGWVIPFRPQFDRDGGRRSCERFDRRAFLVGARGNLGCRRCGHPVISYSATYPLYEHGAPVE